MENLTKLKELKDIQFTFESIHSKMQNQNKKCKIIYAQGKEVVFDLDNFTIENNMLIIKAK